MNVLILDEDAKFRRRLNDLARSLGHHLTEFQAWPSALDFLDGDRPADLMVTELEFSNPGPNGVSFARMARRRRPGLRILFVSNSPELASQVDPRLGLVLLKSWGLAQVMEAILAPGSRRQSAAAPQEAYGQGEPSPL